MHDSIWELSFGNITKYDLGYRACIGVALFLHGIGKWIAGRIPGLKTLYIGPI